MFDPRKYALPALMMLILAVSPAAPANSAGDPPLKPRPVRDDFARDIALDRDGGVYVAGYGRSGPSPSDAVLLKYDRGGRLIWEALYDGPAHAADSAHALVVDARGRIWVTGSSNGPGTSLDAVTLLYDGDGSLLRASRYDGPGARDDYSELLAADGSGGAAAAGNSFGAGTEHDYLLVRFDAAGRDVWTSRYNSPRNRDDMATALALDAAGNVYVTGVDRYPGSNYDWATLKYSPAGERLWLARYTGPDDTYDAPADMAVDARGHVFVTGCATKGEEEFNIVTIRYDSEGNVEWQAEYDGPAGRLDQARALALDGDGNVFVTGKSQGPGTAMDIVLLKYDPSGRKIWEARYDGPAGGADIPAALEMDSRSNILIAGTSRSREGGRDIILLAYGSDGRLIRETRVDGPARDEDSAAALAVDGENGCLLTGTSHGGETGYDILTLKIDAGGKLIWKSRYTGNGSGSVPEK